ncbi:MAG: hypothetical protein IT437_04045 [Phycisphaerales bacterium]|nr:hypothetical protein [Phycisphaerales bacterium]
MMIRVLALCLSLLLTGCGIGYKPLSREQLGRADLTVLRMALEDYHRQYDLSWASKNGWESWSEYRSAIRRSAALQLVPTTPEWREQVSHGEISTGMPQGFVWWSWGPPEDTESTRTPYGQTDTWFYNPGAYGVYKSSVTFQEGLVTWWHVEE